MESPATKRRQQPPGQHRRDRRPLNTPVPSDQQPSRTIKTALIGLMIVISLSMWIVNPALWLLITAHLQASTQPRMGPYALMLLGIVLTCVALGKAISVVHRYYERRTGTTPTILVIAPWRRSLRGGRSMKRETDGRLPLNALDVIMVVSVVLAVISFTLWLLITNPTPPNIGGPGPAKG